MYNFSARKQLKIIASRQQEEIAHYITPCNSQWTEWAPDILWFKLLVLGQKQVLRILWYTSQH